jgi:hypothetical protein
MRTCHDFTRDLVRFTLSRRVSKNWMRATLEYVQRHCMHDPASTLADIDEACYARRQRKYCRDCGATWTEYEEKQ